MAIVASELENISAINSSKLGSSNERTLSSTEGKTEAVASEILKSIGNEPNLGKEMAYSTYNLINKIEEKKINPLVKEAEKIAGTENAPGTIDILLDLSKELSNLNSEKPVLTEKAKNLIEELKGLGIDLLDIEDTKEFSKEQLQDLKTRLNTQSDVQRTKLQQLFTKIQTEMQNIQTMIDSAKKIIADQDRLMQKIAERFLKR